MHINQRRISVINILLMIALLASVILVPSVNTQAASLNPQMRVTLFSGNSTYASTVYVGKLLTFQATIKNVGNVPLNVTANLTVPNNWDVYQEKDSNCEDGPIAPRKSCLVIWQFVPRVAGQVTLRVYARGNYTDSGGTARRITQSPAFIFNVKPPKN
jgi:hypothetical protein